MKLINGGKQSKKLNFERKPKKGMLSDPLGVVAQIRQIDRGIRSEKALLYSFLKSGCPPMKPFTFRQFLVYQKTSSKAKETHLPTSPSPPHFWGGPRSY